MTRKLPALAWAVALAVGGLALVGTLDERREAEAALQVFGAEQGAIARVIAAELQSRLRAVRKDALLAAEAAREGRQISAAIREAYPDLRVRAVDEPPLPLPPGFPAIVLAVPAPDGNLVDLTVPLADLIVDLATGGEPGSLLLLRTPGDTQFHTPDGRIVGDGRLAAALEAGREVARLDRDQAATLGLPERIAYAGLAGIDGGRLGRWGIAVVTSAERLRDRDQRARYRLIFGVLFAGGLVATFGAVALRRQEKELQLARALAVADVERRGDERLEHASRAATLGTLALGIAHELSTPLSVIAGRADQLLARVGDDERARTSVRAILDQTDRIAQVVRGFLGLARGRDLSARCVEPSDVVAGAAGLAGHRFSKAGVTLVTDVEPDLPALWGDPRLLEHALVNLLLNACDACDPGGRVAVCAAAANGSAVKFAVVDDGVGISAADAEHVTEPFFTTKSDGRGTGLGLAIALEIVKSHRGTLQLTVVAPRGTLATITIPVSAEEAKEST